MISFIATLAFPVLLATASPSPSAPAAPVDSATLTLVVVQNDLTVPVTVYAQNGAAEYKLGIVAPLGTETLSVPDYALLEGDIQFFVHPVGQVDESTVPLELHRGERVGLVVPQR